MDKVVLGRVRRSNNVFSWKVSVGDIFASKGGGPYRHSPPFSYKECSWHIKVFINRGTKRFSYAQLRREEPIGGLDSTHVSFALGYRWENGEAVEDLPILNSKFWRYSAYGRCYFLRSEHSLNMAGPSMVTITCRFLKEEDVTQLVDLVAVRNLREVHALVKKLKEAESTISKQKADIDVLIEEKKSNMKEIENLKKLNKERAVPVLNKEVDAWKTKLDEAQSTISKLRADIADLMEEKKSNMKEMENLKKFNEERDLNPEVDASKKKLKEDKSTINELRAELEALSSDFQELLSSCNKCDVVLKVMGREFPVHKSVLVARSPVLRATFSHDSEEEKTGKVTIPDCDPESFPLFLSFLYSGRVGELTVDSAQQLYVTSDKYDVQDLKSICSDHLKRNLTPESVCDVAVLADLHFDDGLMSASQLYFNENYASILQTSEWTATMKNNTRISDKLLKEMASVVGKKPAK